LHVGERQAGTAEALMRSRYSAYAVEDADYIWRTWHPRTRPAAPVRMAGIDWVRLEILDVVDGQLGDETGVVEFRAHYREGRRTGVLHERSRFEVRARRWFYLDGDQKASP
jgi:SEC-C motif domain protein